MDVADVENIYPKGNEALKDDHGGLPRPLNMRMHFC